MSRSYQEAPTPPVIICREVPTPQLVNGYWKAPITTCDGLGYQMTTWPCDNTPGGAHTTCHYILEGVLSTSECIPAVLWSCTKTLIHHLWSYTRWRPHHNLRSYIPRGVLSPPLYCTRRCFCTISWDHTREGIHIRPYHLLSLLILVAYIRWCPQNILTIYQCPRHPVSLTIFPLAVRCPPLLKLTNLDSF